MSAWTGFLGDSAGNALQEAVFAAVRQLARWLYAVTGSSQAAEIGGISTEDLIARFQHGQPRAFEAIYDRFKDYVYRVAFFVLRNQQEAEDAVQETFMDLLKAMPNYDIHGTARFETWLYRVTVNRSRMRLRRKTPPAEEWDDVEERLERLPVPDKMEPEKLILERDRLGHIWRAVDNLPESHRITVLLRYQQNLSYAEIADVLGINVGTVRSRLFNAHAKLKQELEQEIG